MEKIRVLIADDHALVRESLARLLRQEEDMECVGEAEDGEAAIKLVEKLSPDIAIIDVAMPKIDGIEAAREIKKVSQSTRILVISGYDYARYVLACLEVGVDGYVLKKNLPASGFINAIRMVHNGESVFDQEATGKLFRRLGKSACQDKDSYSGLSNRELEILSSAAEGMSNKEIANKLCISESTVATHFVNIYRKLKVESRIEAVIHAIKGGLIAIDNLHMNKDSES